MSSAARDSETPRGKGGRYAGHLPPHVEALMVSLTRCTYGFALMVACDIEGLDADSVRTQLARNGELTLDPQWVVASRLRDLALYLVNTALDVPQAVLAKACDVERSTITRALARVGDRIDEPRIAKLIEIAEATMKGE